MTEQVQQEPVRSSDIEASSNSRSVSENVKSKSIWLRAAFMLAIAFIWGVSRFVTGAVIVIQFLWVLFTGDTNHELKKLGQQLAIYSKQIIDFLTFNSEERPFPFDLDWPEK